MVRWISRSPPDCDSYRLAPMASTSSASMEHSQHFHYVQQALVRGIMHYRVDTVPARRRSKAFPHSSSWILSSTVSVSMP